MNQCACILNLVRRDFINEIEVCDKDRIGGSCKTVFQGSNRCIIYFFKRGVESVSMLNKSTELFILKLTTQEARKVIVNRAASGCVFNGEEENPISFIDNNTMLFSFPTWHASTEFITD